MIMRKQKKGLFKLVAFSIIMMILSAGLGTMLIAQSQLTDIVDVHYNTTLTVERQQRIADNVNTIDFRDYTQEINIVILSMIIIFFAYALWTSYLNTINNFEGVFNFFLLILLLAISSYLANVNAFIWSMPMFEGVNITFTAIDFYFNFLGRINLIIGILICILTLAPKPKKDNVNIAGLG